MNLYGYQIFSKLKLKIEKRYQDLNSDEVGGGCTGAPHDDLNFLKPIMFNINEIKSLLLHTHHLGIFITSQHEEETQVE